MEENKKVRCPICNQKFDSMDIFSHINNNHQRYNNFLQEEVKKLDVKNLSLDDAIFNLVNKLSIRLEKEVIGEKKGNETRDLLKEIKERNGINQELKKKESKIYEKREQEKKIENKLKCPICYQNYKLDNLFEHLYTKHKNNELDKDKLLILFEGSVTNPYKKKGLKNIISKFFKVRKLKEIENNFNIELKRKKKKELREIRKETVQIKERRKLEEEREKKEKLKIKKERRKEIEIRINKGELVKCPFCHKVLTYNKILSHIQSYHIESELELLKQKINELEKLSIVSEVATPQFIFELNLLVKIQKEEKEKQSKKKKRENKLKKREQNSKNLKEAIRKSREQELRKINEPRIIYFTWDDISFENNSIRINPKYEIFQIIKVTNSYNILNQIKVEYFNRLYPTSLFKVTMLKSKIIEEESDLDKLRVLINEVVINVKDKLNIRKALKEFERKKVSEQFENQSQEQLIEKISDKKFHNEFLKIPALLLTKTEKLIPILENNNGKFEESLLFVFNRNDKIHILWENINPNRAGYLFTYSATFERQALVVISSLIRKDTYGKRDKLYRSDGTQFFKLNCEKYISFKHENTETYKQKLLNVLDDF